MSLKSQFTGLTPLLTWYRVFEESGRSFDVGSAPSLSISWYIKFTQADMVIFPEHVGQYCMKVVIKCPYRVQKAGLKHGDITYSAVALSL